ncbi:metalloregulator ArsR/SmtB family transcription factor [Paracoccus gahaiensis]|uniref:metalloregulator ArsR/SmtB family transcription factor n=1 Tax=Paracoccus gahaiensis TaxID=1706839 RepID=UPI001B7F8063|nr:metalloregulator ArsR/SmtB family transcription factor [Paracoccus gahaiensis]
MNNIHLADRNVDAAAVMFAALSEPNRLRLLLRLAAGGASVTDLAAMSNEKLTTVSARLAVLHAARLVARRREGKSILYSLADHHVLTMVTNAIDHACEDH